MADDRELAPEGVSGFSPLYYAGIEEGAAHHAASKTYSGSLMRPHVPYLSEMIRRLGITSAIDVGAGKGTQYRWQDPYHSYQTVEERWGFEVRKYDPCYEPFAAEPEGKFDLVICTHTFSLIPIGDQEHFLNRLYGWANKAVFIAEKIGDRKKGEVADPTERAIGWTVEQWLDRLAPFADARPETETVFSSRERIGDATITTRHRRMWGGWVSVVAGPQ